MPDLKLKRLVMRNWAMIRDADIELPDKGLILVIGDNKASEGFMSSVGAGKTSVGEGLCRALLGCEARSSAITSYSTHKKGNTYLKVEAEVKGVPLIVELGYKCPEFQGSGEALRYQYGAAEPVQRATLAMTRAELAEIVNIQSGVADWTVLVDGDRIKFNNMPQADSVELVMNALNQPPWTSYHARAKTVVDELKVEADTAINTRNQVEGSIAVTKRRIEEARQDIEDAKSDYDDRIQKQEKSVKKANEELEAFKKEVEEVETRRLEIATEIEKLVAQDAAKQHEIEIAVNEMNDDIRKLRTAHNALISDEASKKAALRSAERALKDLTDEPDDCPKCGKPWDKEHGEEEITKAESAVTEATKAYEAAQKATNKSSTKITKAEDEVTAKKESLKNLSGAKVKVLSKEDKDLEADLKDINADLRKVELTLERLKAPVDNSEVKTAEGRLKERKNSLKDLTKQLEELGESIIEAQEAMKVAQYWRTAFGPTGIPNMLLEEAITPLNEVSTALGKRITGGSLSVTYSTKRQLATGRSKSQLIVEVDNKYGSAEAKMGSKGECGLTNFFMSETLSEVGNVPARIGFKWYDEVVPHHDATLCRAIYGYMREQAHRNGTLIFLVDHNPVAENFADHVLVVEKGQELSKVYWR